MRRAAKATPVAARLTARDLGGLYACILLALAAQLGSVPVWVLATSAAIGAIRVGLAHVGRDAPPLALRLVIAIAGVALLYLQFRTFNGLSAGSALLSLLAGLKLLETVRRRDLHVITLLIYFLVLASLLLSDSFWLLAYALAVCWLTTVALLRLTSAPPVPGWRETLNYTGKILLQAVPLAVACWLLFPRFAGPLWQLPGDNGRAQTGLTDSMSPGDITELARSEDIAFHARFEGAPPPLEEMYWRGPVLHDFDGRTWKRGSAGWAPAAPLAAEGPAYRYVLSLEPHDHEWLLALDWPSQWSVQDAALSNDYVLVQPTPLARPLAVRAVSHTHVAALKPLSAYMRSRDTLVPTAGNPRTMELAHTLRREHPDDEGYIAAVLGLFSREAFYYTLTPPRLAADSVDAFLFDTRRGFCGHYASAFALLMRAAGIPARVVTGYQGGALNPYGNEWIVRQSNAHAWDEVWIAGHGWRREDPTAAILPSRVDPDVALGDAAESSLPQPWRHQPAWLSNARLRLDAMRQVWRERILLFDQSSQEGLLAAMHIPEPDGEKLVVLLAAALAAVFAWLTWSIRGEVARKRGDPLVRVFERLCAKLARAGLPRPPHEGAEQFAARAAHLRPDLAPEILRLCLQYSRLRYAGRAPDAEVRELAAAVRAFKASRPRDSRGSP